MLTYCIRANGFRIIVHFLGYDSADEEALSYLQHVKCTVKTLNKPDLIVFPDLSGHLIGPQPGS